ncbi:MAG: hypothetical protein ACRBCI_04960 [Cellvibrionaceae bacterium]
MNATIDTIVNTLNQQILSAKAEEAQTGAMSAFIHENMSNLHGSINISSQTPDAALMRFVEDYIESAPQHIQALHTLANEAGIGEYAQPFLNLSCTYFINPPDVLASLQGLHSFLCRAYLAHRLMEEVNDQIMSLSGAALAPMDMSMANIITHSLIGDDIANALDHLVLLSIETEATDKNLFQKRSVRKFLEQRKLKDWEEVLKRWPCFTKDCAVDLQIGQEPH